MSDGDGGNDGDEEDRLLLNGLLMEDGDDDFVTQEQREQRQAEERRRKRKLRLQQLAQKEGVERQEKRYKQEDEAKKDEPSKPQHQQQHNATTKLDDDTTRVLKRPPDGVIKEEQKDGDKGSENDDNVDGDFDMFSSSVSPIRVEQQQETATTNNAGATRTSRGGNEQQQDWDDAEGYYKAMIGETIDLDYTINNTNNTAQSSAATAIAKSTTENSKNNANISLRVSGVIGKGVFSTVLKCTTVSNSSSIEMLPPVTAVKFIRHNETMAKAAVTEIQMLQRLRKSPGIVPLLLPTNTNTILEHRGHVILVFDYMEYNLRDVLQKFGKGVGLSLTAVRSYFGQLLAASTHLKKHNCIHGDVKPDNILVSADFSVVQLGDFGSSMDAQHAPELQQPTPYLVSRFYRAPEIILGLSPISFAIDLWSLAVTAAELFLGDVLFKGTSNNAMLYDFMQHLGAFPNRVIRQHLVQCRRFVTVVPPHFSQVGPSYQFTQQTTDPVTGAPVHRVLSLLPHHNNDNSNTNAKKFPLATPLHQKLLKAKSTKDSRKLVQLFSDLLQQCLHLDATRRIDLREALRHEFFTTTTSNGSNSTKKEAS